MSARHLDITPHRLAPRPIDPQIWICLEQLHARLEKHPEEPMAGFPSDDKGAYRQVHACPVQALDFIVSIWDPVLEVQVFLIAVSQLFGRGNAPFNCTRCPDSCRHAIGV